MGNNYTVSSLLPFINEGEVSYYADLETEKLTLLVSLAPFVNNSDTLMKLSKLYIINLQELAGKLPQIDVDDINEYFDKLLL